MFHKVRKAIRKSDAGSVPSTAGYGSTEREASVIGAGVRLRGEIEGSGELVIQGRVEGSVEIEGTIAIGPDGRSEGLLRAGELVLDGTVRGDAEATVRVVISASGLLHGSMNSPRLVIEEGGRLQGRCRMREAPQEETARAGEAAGATLPTFPGPLEADAG